MWGSAALVFYFNIVDQMLIIFDLVSVVFFDAVVLSLGWLAPILIDFKLMYLLINFF